MLWYKEPTCIIYRPGKTSEKWPGVKSYLLNKKPPVSTLPKNIKWSELRCMTCRPDLKVKTYLIVRNELSLNEN